MMRESERRSATESKKLPRWLARWEALATAPSKMSWNPVRVRSTTATGRNPAPMAQAVARANTRPEAVRTSAETPARTSQRPTGAVVASKPCRNLPSNIDLPGPRKVYRSELGRRGVQVRTDLGPGRREGFGQYPGLDDRGHEVGVAAPSRQDVG